MVKRNLRKRTKKVDYQKLNTTGVDKELISGGEPAITSSEYKQDGGDQNKQTIEHHGGTSWESVSDAECEVILPGDKLSSAEKRLRDLKNERNKLIEKEKSRSRVRFSVDFISEGLVINHLITGVSSITRDDL